MIITVSNGFNLACDATNAFAGVPTGNTNAYEHDNVTGMMKNNGFLFKNNACETKRFDYHQVFFTTKFLPHLQFDLKLEEKPTQ